MSYILDPDVSKTMSELNISEEEYCQLYQVNFHEIWIPTKEEA